MNQQQERYLRFPLVRRIEHWLTALLFIVLAVTGLPQKYASAAISESTMRLLGGIEMVRLLHRYAAIGLALIAIWHVGYGLYGWYVQRKRASILLGRQDALAAWQSLRYNIGKTEERPRQGFYTFEEKVEYWALIWGTLIMVVTGFFLWNPITAARLLPGQWIPAAKAAHGGEALLAVLAIIIWHLYMVLVRTFNRSMFTGYMSREEMLHEHPLALEEAPPPQPDPAELARRKRRFWFAYSGIATIWLIAVIWFVTSEQTALATVPEPDQIEAYVPLPTAVGVAGLEVDEAARRLGTTWENGIGQVVVSRCGQCHNARTGESNLNLTTLEGAISGGDSGPAVIPEAPGASLVLVWPELEDHPGQLSPRERAAVWGWIADGAPEQ